MDKTNLSVSAIQNGTVIDHIRAGQGLRILHLLSIQENRVTLGLNLRSSTLGLKDLIKIEAVYLTEEQISQIAIFAPSATVNVIRDYAVIEKHQVHLPLFIHTVLSCPNRLCITNTDQIKTYFSVKETPSTVQLRCRFCEKVYNRDQL